MAESHNHSTLGHEQTPGNSILGALNRSYQRVLDSGYDCGPVVMTNECWRRWYTELYVHKLIKGASDVPAPLEPGLPSGHYNGLPVHVLNIGEGVWFFITQVPRVFPLISRMPHDEISDAYIPNDWADLTFEQRMIRVVALGRAALKEQEQK